jgi:hypothetical protein
MLPAAKAAGAEEVLGVLEIIMEVRIVGRIGDRRRDDLAFGESGAVMHGDYADDVIGVLDDDGLEAAASLDQVRHRLEQSAVVGIDVAARGDEDRAVNPCELARDSVAEDPRCADEKDFWARSLAFVFGGRDSYSIGGHVSIILVAWTRVMARLQAIDF